MKNVKMKLLACCLLAVPAAWAATLQVDFKTELGAVKPVNSVGQPPMIDALIEAPMFKYLKDAGIPYSRLHDVGGWLGHGLYVDIPNLFPNFEADENDEKNYSFAFTDAVLLNLQKNNVEPFFRLGITIENFVGWNPSRKKPAGVYFPAQRSNPPKDFAKWARICEHVIRHYNEGWAKGFHMNITYWEIWNEPENHPDAEYNPMFRAPFSEYIRLYGIAATHLKKCFPNIKVGGLASCGFYAAVKGPYEKAANSSPRTEYFVACAKEFLSAVRDNKWPLDFMSYHSYAAPDSAMAQVRYADELLTSYGFSREKTERIYNEWLPYVTHDNLGTALQAAGVAAELIGLQNGPCDLACIYDARCGVGNYSPLFNPLTYKPHKAYYAFTAFNELRKCGKAVKVISSNERGLWATAAKGNDSAAIMLANDSKGAIPITLDTPGYTIATCRMTDNDQTDATIPWPGTLPPHSFCVILLKKDL